MSELPVPDPEALRHSDRLAALIRDEIAASGGHIPFSRFMERCLYAPGLGYYSAGAPSSVPPAISSPRRNSARCSQAAWPKRWRRCCSNSGRKPEFLEIGGGSGAFAETMLKRLLALDAMPARYAILEPSADLRERQRERLGRGLIPPVFDLVEWLDGPPEADWNGVLFANEVIDALPTPRFTLHEGEVFEEHVALDAEGALHAQRPARRCAACGRGAPFGALPGCAFRRGLPFRTVAAIAVLDAGGDGRAAGRRDAVRRLRLPAARVLPAAARAGHAARVLSPPRPQRCLPVAGPAGPHRFGRFHRVGRGRHAGRLRPGRLLRAGQLPARQRPAETAGRSADARRRCPHAATAQRSQDS